MIKALLDVGHDRILPDTQEEKSRKLAVLQELQARAQTLQTDLQQYAENDPERVEAIGRAASPLWSTLNPTSA